MTNLSREFCLSIRDARRQKGISQSVLAAEIGCKQSALSMFEQGDGTKLNDEAVKKLSKKFGIEIPSGGDKEEESILPAPGYMHVSARREPGFCPNPDCPTNARRHEVNGEVFIVPEREKADPVDGRYCAMCGEVLEKLCPHCGRHVHDGAVCSFCGKKYIGD